MLSSQSSTHAETLLISGATGLARLRVRLECFVRGPAVAGGARANLILQVIRFFHLGPVHRSIANRDIPTIGTSADGFEATASYYLPGATPGCRHTIDLLADECADLDAFIAEHGKFA